MAEPRPQHPRVCATPNCLKPVRYNVNVCDDCQPEQQASTSTISISRAFPPKISIHRAPEAEKMRAVVLRAFGGFKEVHEVLDQPLPKAPKKGQIQIKVKLSALNLPDVMTPLGFVDRPPPKTPFILGTELVGVVTALGEGDACAKFKIGQRVFALPEFGGGWAEFANVEALLAWSPPEGLALESVAATNSYLVAWLLLARAGELEKGSVVVVHSAGGGVGTALAEMAYKRGLKVIGLCGNKINAIKTNSELFVYYEHLLQRGNGHDYVNEIKKRYPRGVSAVFDCQGGKDCARGLSLLAPMGTYVLYGYNNILKGETRLFHAFQFDETIKWLELVKKVSPMRIFEENKALGGLHVRDVIRGARDKVTSALDAIWGLMSEGKLTPVIYQSYPFEQIVPAMRNLIRRENIGKVLIYPITKPEEVTLKVVKHKIKNEIKEVKDTKEMAAISTLATAIISTSASKPSNSTPAPEVKKMWAVVLTSFGGMKGVVCLERPQPPAPKEGQIQIKVKLSALNFQDLMIRLGFVDSPPPKTPFILGTELVGVVTALGDGVDCAQFKIGQRVFALPEFGGGWAEFANVEARLVWPAPEGLALESVAATNSYLVAWLLLARAGELEKGSVVVVHSAGGGVGTALRELAMARGLVVVGICGERKKERLEALGGYAHLLQRGNGHDYVNEIKKLYPGGVSAVFDCQGGDDCARGLSLLAPMGTYVLFGSNNIVTGETRGFLAFAKGWWGQVEKVSPMRIFEENKALSGLHVRHVIRDARDKVTSALDAIWGLMSEGKLTPVIDQRYHFEQIVPAMQRLHQRENIGKVLISPEVPPAEEAKEVEAEVKGQGQGQGQDNGGSGDNGSEAEK